MKALTVKNLTIRTREGKDLVKNLSFNVGKNETAVLLGASGSGKSMTCMAILRLLPPGVAQTDGRILIDGLPFSPEMRGGRIGMIMQSPASCFDPVFTMRTQFTDILRSHGKKDRYKDEQLCKMIAAVELENPRDILAAYPFQLSGGTLQRLMIALTLALEPSFIIADEPTSDLDPAAQTKILRLLTDGRGKEKGMLMITHDIGAALRTADQIFVMQKGALVDSFSPHDAREECRHPYTQKLIAADRWLCDNPWQNAPEGKDA